MIWQPIETAPKNEAGKFYGPTILIYCVGNELPWPAYWGPANKTAGYGEGAWFISDDNATDNEIAPQYVSHWMPLPPKPEQAK